MTAERRRVLMFHPDRLPRLRLYSVRWSRVNALLLAGWGIYGGRFGGRC